MDDSVLVIRGIPYACPPFGKLRFASPQPPHTWIDVFRGHSDQPAGDVGGKLGEQRACAGLARGEDCLTLNVWTPAVDDARRPVLVWLHGGAFLTGAGSRPMNHGAVLARRGDIVVVTINYQLGLWGWLRGIEVCGQALPSIGNEACQTSRVCSEFSFTGNRLF